MVKIKKLKKLNKQLIIILLSIGLLEIIKYSKILFLVRNNLKLAYKIIQMLKSKLISDHWKEKVLLRYSFELLFNSFKILFIFSLIVVFSIILNMFDSNFYSIIFSIEGTIKITIVIFLYLYLRKKLIG